MADSEEQESGAPPAFTVLCVDDSETKRYLRGHALRSAGFEVIEAEDAAGALRLAVEKQPALIILDIRLPDMDGFEVCDRLRCDPRTRAIPVLHVSAVGRAEQDLPRALEHESDAYLREPIEPETLAATARALIRSRHFRDRLRRSEARFRGMLENAFEGIWAVDLEGRTEFVNHRMAEMLGVASPAEMTGRSAFDFFDDEDRAAARRRISNLLATDGSGRFETRLRRADGSTIWVSLAGSTLFDEQGRPCGRMALFTDITEQRRARAELLESRQRLELALEAGELGTWEMELASGMVTASPRTCAMFDIPAPLSHAGDWVARMHPEDRDRVARELEEAATAQRRFDAEYRVIKPDGGVRWAHAKAAPVGGASGRLVGIAQDITARKEAEESRERERELLQGIVENIPVMLCLYDPHFQRFELNAETTRALGWTNADANEGDFMAKVYPDPASRASAAEYMQSLTPGWRELEPAAKDGTKVRSEWANVGLSDGRMIGIGIDVRGRKAAEERLRITLESIGDGFFACDAEWRFVYVNAAAERLLGIRREEVLGRNYWEACPLKLGTELQSEYRRAAAGEPRDFEYYYEPWGRWFHNRCFPRAGGGASVFFQDITERKRTEEAVAAYRATLEAALASMMESVFICDTQGRLVTVNDAFATVHRFRNRAEAARNIAEYPEILEISAPDGGAPIPVEDWAAMRALRGESASNIEHRLRRTDTGEMWLGSYSFGPIRGKDGAILGAVVVGRDVTDIKGAEQALRESEARERARAAELDAILEAAPVAMFVAKDPECQEMIGNRKTYEMLRLPEGANVSKSAPDAPTTFKAVRDGGEIPAPELPAQKAAASGKPVRNFEFDVVYQDGTTRNMVGDAVPLFDEEGRPRGAVGAFVEVTEMKRNEERLRQTQKLESVGLLAGGIAHDFNNLLVGIMGNASMALDEVPPAAAEPLKEVIACAERAAHLTRQLLAYSGKGQFVMHELDVSEAVHEISDLVQFSIPKSVRLSVGVEMRLPSVRMDPGQLQQILMNLVINAGEAIGDGNPGRIEIATSMQDVAAEFLDASGGPVAPGRYVCIEIRDTGCGMDEATRKMIFDPFFTTKFTGRGLGLAAVSGIVRAQRGGIVVTSTPGAGTTFRVLLRPSERARDAAATSQEGATTVLVVDDERAVRSIVSAALRKAGYRVLTASDGREALEICERQGERIDAVIVDIVMPVMGANELLPGLRARQPGARILLTSGYSEGEARRLCADYPDAAFLQKPFTARQVTDAIKGVQFSGGVSTRSTTQ